MSHSAGQSGLVFSKALFEFLVVERSDYIRHAHSLPAQPCLAAGDARGGNGGAVAAGKCATVHTTSDDCAARRKCGRRTDSGGGSRIDAGGAASGSSGWDRGIEGAGSPTS